MNADYDFKIEKTKNEINEYYKEIKNEIDIQGQTVLAKIRKANRFQEASLKTYLKSIHRIQSIQNCVMRKFNLFVEYNAEKVKNMSKEELFRSHVESIVLTKYEELKDDSAGDEIGVLIYSDWHLSQNQIDFIKIKLIKQYLAKDLFRWGYVFFLFIYVN